MSDAKPESKVGYLCGIAWQHEVGEADKVELYGSLEDAKADHPAYEQCGIVKVLVSEVEWVVPQDLDKGPVYESLVMGRWARATERPLCEKCRTAEATWLEHWQQGERPDRYLCDSCAR